MPKMTLLEMTQNILSAIDGDEVNSIGDTVEALQVATVIRETYYEIQAGLRVPTREGLIQLDALSDSDKPNYLRLPDNVKDIRWVKYNYDTDGTVDYRVIQYLAPEEFIQRQSSTTFQESRLISDFSGVQFYIGSDTNPSYWTNFDNEHLVFDAYNNDLDSTLQNSKTMCWGQYDPVFPMVDDAYPDLDTDLFPLLLAEAKAVCFINFKGVSSAKEEQRSRRQRVRSQNDLWRANQRRPYDRTPNYGRGRGGVRRK